ncbi:hypothetical protein A11A3_00020 [Alcanivorax hongdengensis A-11-3]|uniref:Outer membrane protein beta-barrel domain-containing protein n=1 Tax=Alcanivorax hongdengensis A-11-3 TaxID=1177179 RepID=L0WI46_9GAMM|nr:hypothetical protein A11A3_00020 [Alcanivorax hongdengensis A-11-3]
MLPVAGQAADDGAVNVRDADAGSVLDPRIERRRIHEADIDTENFEVGAYAGVLAIDNFSSEPLVGLRLGYHINEDVFLEAQASMSKAGDTSFEKLNAGVQLLTDDQREYRAYEAAVGYNLLPGEAFFGDGRAFNTSLYLIGGAGVTDFAGDQRFTLNLGAGYRVLMNDWLSLRLDMRDHIFDLDTFGSNDTTHNLELSLGLGAFF